MAGFRRIAGGLIVGSAMIVGGVAMSSSAWAADQLGASETAACRLTAEVPHTSGSSVQGYGARSGCSDSVTYFWVRVYKVVDWWPDSEKAVEGRTHFQNGRIRTSGSCDGRGEHYTHTSTATGATGDSVESGRRVLC